MEVNTNILIGLLFIAILILLFSKISVSVGSNINNTTNAVNNSVQRPYITSRVTEHPQTISSARNLTLAEAQGLPNKDNYMPNSLKQQLNNLENRFYYNNCRWEPNF
jgi:hypothetical protein